MHKQQDKEQKNPKFPEQILENVVMWFDAILIDGVATQNICIILEFKTWLIMGVPF